MQITLYCAVKPSYSPSMTAITGFVTLPLGHSGPQAFTAPSDEELARVKSKIDDFKGDVQQYKAVGPDSVTCINLLLVRIFFFK